MECDCGARVCTCGKREGGAGARSVVLLSGGLDSTVALHWAMQNGPVVACLTFCYGQRHWVEKTQAGKIARRHKLRHEIETLGPAGLGFSALGQVSPFAPQIDTIKDVVIPARNMMFLAVAGMWAEALKADEIVVGFSKDDADDFPDCRPAFVRAAAECLSLSLGRRIRVRAPLISQPKALALHMAKDWDGCWDDIALSWTCYDPEQVTPKRGHVRPCGGCPACILRASSFDAAGLEDPGIQELKA